MDKDWKRKQVSYLVCSLSGNLYISIDSTGKFDTTTKIDEARIFKSKSQASKVLVGLNNKIRKKATGWKVIEIERKFENNKIKYSAEQYGNKDYEVSESILDDFISLCNRLENLTNITEELHSVYDKKSMYLDLLEMYERQQCDILHKIEDSKFNACEGYYYAKMIKDIRNKRRQVKNVIRFIDRTGGSDNISIIMSEIKSLQTYTYYSRALDETG